MRAREVVGGALAASLLAVGCAEGGSRHFDNREGDIVAGRPATVLEVWHSKRSTGKYGPEGYVMYLVTEDCDDGHEPVVGDAVGDHCEENRHRAEPETYRRYSDGDTIYWDDRDGPSEVIEHRYGTDRYYATVYDLGLLVKQCVSVGEPGEHCVEDFVEVGFTTWSNAHEGDVITFGGDDGEVVSG